MTDSISPPMRDVERAFNITGPRGGTEMVHVLTCGCWVINRRKFPARKLRCIACGLNVVHDSRRESARRAFLAGVQHKFSTTSVDESFDAWWAQSR